MEALGNEMQTLSYKLFIEFIDATFVFELTNQER
jgi:hypothetical protein